MIYSEIGGLQCPLPQKLLAAKFTSQDDVHVRTDAQIKFLYYPLKTYQTIDLFSVKIKKSVKIQFLYKDPNFWL